MNKHTFISPYKLKPSSHKVSLGVTLIEMLISLTIGLLIIAGIGYAYLGTKQSFRGQEVLSRMQEGARTTFEIMAQDLRMAGFTACPSNATDINILTASTDWDKNLLAQPLIGYERTAGAWSAFPAGVTGVVGSVKAGDALTVLRADNSREYIVSSHDTAASQITLTANHDLQKGTILVAAKPDCSRVAVFQQTNNCTLTAAGSCGTAIIQHGSNTVTTTYALGSPAGTVDTFDAGSRIYRLNAVTYYIDNNPGGEKALYRRVLGTSGTIPNNSAEELIEGVQDMQLLYGEDIAGGVDKVEAYRTADNVADWSKVLGIRISLLMVSRSDEGGITTGAQSYALDMNGDGDATDTFDMNADGDTNDSDDAKESVTPTDRLLRKVFTTTIAVKNRL